MRVESDSSDRRALAWLMLIVAVGAWLRLRGLTYQSYWFDELFSAYYSNPSHSFAEMVRLTLGDVHPPLYQVLMWFSYKVFGYNEWAGRLPSVIAGILTVPALYWLGRELFDRRTGLYAAALAVPLYYLVYYAQEARSYALFCLLCCLSFAFFVRALRRPEWSNVAGYIVATIALLYTHYFGFVLLVAQGLVFLLYWRSSSAADDALIWRGVVSAAAVVMAALPMVPWIQRHAAIQGFWIEQPGIGVLFEYVPAYFQSAWIGLCFAALMGWALVAGWRRAPAAAGLTETRFGLLALLLWLTVGYLMPWLRGLMAQPVITDRNTIMLLPAIVLLAAFGIRMLRPRLVRQVVLVLLLVGMSAHLFVGLDYYSAITKNQYRELTTDVLEYPQGLPIYAMEYNDTKFNVYLEQLGSAARSTDFQILEERLEAGTAEPLFWLVDARGWLLQTDMIERFKLPAADEYKRHSSIALLLVNPARSRQIALQPAGDEGGFVSAAIDWAGDADELLVAVAESDRQGQLQPYVIEIVGDDGELVLSADTELGYKPASYLLRPSIAAGTAVQIRIKAPAGAATPRVWVVPRSAVN